MYYPVTDWVTDLPEPDPVFTVGASSVRGDGIAVLQQVCADHGWALNLPDGHWRSIEDEVRRLARSTVNVCWYHTGGPYKDRASAPSTMIAAKRAVLINQDLLLEHLHSAADLYHGVSHSSPEDTAGLTQALEEVEADWRRGRLIVPKDTYEWLSWTRAAERLVESWGGAA
jgi:hypothetical protein